MNLALWIHRVKISRANKETGLDSTHCLAYLMIDADMRLWIDLEDVQPEFRFSIHTPHPKSS
jgi:hypothetical protein